MKSKKVVVLGMVLVAGGLVLSGCTGIGKENKTSENKIQMDSVEGEVSIGGIEIDSPNGSDVSLSENQIGQPLTERPVSAKDMPKQGEVKKGQATIKDEIIDVKGLKSPGIADALLTKDAMVGVVMELTMRGCDEYDSHKSYMLKEPVMETAKKGSWQERWIVSACDKKYQIDLNFVEVIGEGTDWTIIK